MDRLRVVHFSDDFSIEEITNYLKDKSDILYYTRTLKEGKEFHLVKYNDSAFFEMHKLQSELFKFYNNNISLKPHLKGLKIKGNSNFSITENMNPIIVNKIKNDLNNILKK
ncbi:hypothetical protein [Trichloromonas sp.]|uniref:hypothetical protein n=1 Tax=Trichloromonas sp. TaxID=3069249 RepID=UPI002A478B20|nr:hypothetical protein [Trichloromonas sp.]